MKIIQKIPNRCDTSQDYFVIELQGKIIKGTREKIWQYLNDDFITPNGTMQDPYEKLPTEKD